MRARTQMHKLIDANPAWSSLFGYSIVDPQQLPADIAERLDRVTIKGKFLDSKKLQEEYLDSFMLMVVSYTSTKKVYFVRRRRRRRRRAVLPPPPSHPQEYNFAPCSHTRARWALIVLRSPLSPGRATLSRAPRRIASTCQCTRPSWSASPPARSLSYRWGRLRCGRRA